MGETPQVPQPFQPLPADAGGRPGDGTRSGCGKPVLLGCGALLLLLLGASLYLVTNAGKVFRWGLEQSRAAILQAVPEGVEEEEVDRLEQAFEAVADAVSSGGVERSRLRLLQNGLQEALSKAEAGRLTDYDVQLLTERLERVAAEEPP